jgi:predicted subunit of tRNA(5-methylaminomethyl-2-thiouridylate) methyltransferase
MTDSVPDVNVTPLKPKPVALPVTTEDLLAARKAQSQRTLNDYVEEAYIALWPNEEFRRLLEAVYNEDAVEGSCDDDDHEAAKMIRDFARKDDRIPYLMDKKIATIIKSLRVVMRRYGFGRKERAQTVGGEVVHMNNDNT